MKLSPREIARHEFSRALRGYDPDEVRAYLERLSDDVYVLQKEVTQLAERQASLAARPETPAAAGDEAAGPEMERERERLIAEARMEADEIKQEAMRDLGKLREEIRGLKTHRDAFVKRLRLLLKSQTELLELMEDETPVNTDEAAENAPD